MALIIAPLSPSSSSHQTSSLVGSPASNASQPTSKHFVNDPTRLVSAALVAVTRTNPAVALDAVNKIIYRRPEQNAPAAVALVSGGGSGHEPSFAGFVGRGLLTAAVAGTIFASPSAQQVRRALESRVDPSRGVLVIVMNYTGDVLNFGIAVEKAKAAGLYVDMVVVGDDVGVGRAKAGKVGRRGIAGTVLVHKIAGALAAQGADLPSVAKVARLVAANLVSVGASLEHVHVPGREARSTPSHLGAHEAEIGMGIHNEPGCGTEKADLPALVRAMLCQLLDQADPDRAFLHVNSNEPVLLVNNLGGVSVLEMGAVTAEVLTQLEEIYSIRPVRVLSGSYMTSLNGMGFSITLLNVVNTDIGGPSMIQLLDYPAEACGWAAPIQTVTWDARNQAVREGGLSADPLIVPSGLEYDADLAQRRLQSALKAVAAVEPEVTRYDGIVGDGDCGIGLKRGAESVLSSLLSSPLSGDPVLDVARIVPVVEDNMDGTSGALYAIFLNALMRGLRSQHGQATPAVWAAALRKACDAMSAYTPARPGDRTLVDALYPFVDELESSRSLVSAIAAAKLGAEKTRGMQAKLGRAVYVSGDGFEKVPDPGAWGLATLLGGLAGT